LDSFPGGVVTAHSVESDFHGYERLGNIDRNDFFAFVVTAGGTYPVGHFSAFALGANRERLSLDFPVGATLIPALT
jgi:hypothetical protein